MRKPSWLEYKKILKHESSFGDMSRCEVPENIWDYLFYLFFLGVAYFLLKMVLLPFFKFFPP